jgi:tetratricopeptide (TPR) repeat protein
VAAGARDPATRSEALVEAALLARDLERDDQRAQGLLRQVLDTNPLHPQAGPALEELLARRGGAADLIALHEKRGDVKQAQRDLPAAAREYLEAARRLAEGGGDQARVVALVDRALAAVPTHPEALELKGRLALEARDFVAAAAAWSARVRQGGDPRALARLHLRLGLLYAEQLDDPGRAASHLQSAVAGEPTNVEALERLAAIHTASKNFTGAADCLRRLLDLESGSPARARHTVALARLADEGFNDVGQAITLYRKALDLLPGDATVLDRLGVLYERTGASSDLLAVLERQAQQVPDLKRSVAIRTRIATLQGRQLGEPQRAVAAWQRVLEVDPQNLAAHLAIAEILGRDTSSIGLAIEAHRAVLRLDPTRVESLHALFRMWESLRQLDKAYCAAAVLAFLRGGNETESAFYTEGRNRLVNDFRGSLGTADLVALHHPHGRGPVADVLRAVGDQVSRLYPPQFDLAGIDRKADRLKGDHALVRAIQVVAALFGVEEFETYQARRGLVVLETTEPPAVCVGPEVVRRSLREQRFLFGRAALGVHDRTALLRRLPPGDLADFLGNAVRIRHPAFDGLGRASEEQSRQLRRAFSRKALKALEEPADAATSSPRTAIELVVQGLTFSADRAGLLACADVSSGLGVLLREDGPAGQPRPETPEAIAAAVSQRPDVKELIGFALADDFFRLRQRIGVSLG